MAGSSRSWTAFIAATAMLGAVFAGGGPPAIAAPVVLPERVTLDGPAARQTIVVHHRLPGGQGGGDPIGGPVAGDVRLTVADQSVARAVGLTLVGVGDGATTATITSPAGEVTIPVSVTGIANPDRLSFTNDALPVLARAGCNSGACHGALAGKGGFRLSLRGYDGAGDHRRITAEAGGRRIELADPGRSLLLAKPTGAIPHKGGVRLDVDSSLYRTLATWIAEGAVGPSGAEQPGRSRRDAPLTNVEIFPKQFVVTQGEPVRLFVQATYADGRTEDVTDRAKFTSADEAIARVDDDGNVTVLGHGVGAITAWYSQQIAVARLVSPFDRTLPADVFANQSPVNFIDERVNAQLQALNLAPGPICDDATFLRRAHLDTIGLLPTPEETEAFLADERLDKRVRVVDSLLSRQEFVDYWTYKWSDIMLISGTHLRPAAVKSYYHFVRQEVEANTPWDQFVRKIVTAKGESLTDGATNFYAVHQDPETMSENVAQAFLGLGIACAKCHNHPLEKWTNDQYYGMANHFARVRAKGWGGDGRNGDGARTIYVADRGELIQPLTGRPQPPTPLAGEPIGFDDPRDRREVLADWLTDPSNTLFSRAIVNRVWANFFGQGLVEPVDDLRASNPPRNEPLMEAAANYLVEHRFDLKQLMRAILISQTYQRSSEPTEGNRDDSHYFARYYPRRMMAEVLHDAIVSVTDVPTTFDAVAFPGADKQKTDFYPQGTRAIELYDAAVDSYFLQSHGRNPREIVCECERSDVPSMTQVLHLCNGDTVLKKLQDKQSRVSTWLASRDIATKESREDEPSEGRSGSNSQTGTEASVTSDEKVPPATPEPSSTVPPFSSREIASLIDEVYLRALCRKPTESERASLANLLAEADAADRRTVIEDLFWAVLSSREFLFQH